VVKGISPGDEVDDENLDKDQPEASFYQEARQLVRGPPPPRKEGGNATQEDECRSAEVGNPTRKEKEWGCRLQVGWVGMSQVKQVSQVIDGHNEHNKAAKQIDRKDTGFRGRDYGRFRRDKGN